MNRTMTSKKRTIDASNIHANMGMSSNELNDVVDGQIKEIENLKAGLTNRIVPLQTSNVNETSENMVKTNYEVKAEDKGKGSNTFRKKARRFLLVSFIIAFSCNLLLLLISIPTATDDDYFEFWEDNEFLVYVFLGVSLVISVLVHSFLKYKKIPIVVNLVILVVYCISFYFFINGIAGQTEKEVSVIIFLLNIGYPLICSIYLLTSTVQWGDSIFFFIVLFIYLIICAGTIFVEPEIWYVTFVGLFFAIAINIWCLVESLLFVDKNHGFYPQFEEFNFAGHTLSVIT